MIFFLLFGFCYPGVLEVRAIMTLEVQRLVSYYRELNSVSNTNIWGKFVATFLKHGGIKGWSNS